MKERIGFKAIANFSCKATVLILAVALCVFFASCKKDVVENKLVEITFLSTDGYWIEDGAQVTQKKVLVPYGSALTDYKPSMPVAQYMQLAGWFEQTDSGLSDIAFRFVEPVTRPVTLYAQWKKLVEGHTVILMAAVENGETFLQKLLMLILVLL